MSVRISTRVWPTVRSLTGSIRYQSTNAVQVGTAEHNGNIGDPGPSTSRAREQKKSQRKRLMETSLTSRSGRQDVSLNVLDSILEQSPPLRAPPRVRDQSDGNQRPFSSENAFSSSSGKRKGFGLTTRVHRSERPSTTGRSPDFVKRNTSRNPSSSSSPSFERPSYPSQESNFHRQKDGPFALAGRMKAWIQSHEGDLTGPQTEEICDMVMSAPKSDVNVVNWNMLYTVLGRVGRLDRMWRAYNDMKKRGIKPNSRTYTTLLNAYASISHSDSPVNTTLAPPLPRTQSRVSIIYSQALEHIKNNGKSTDPISSGLAYPTGTTEAPENPEISIGPINAYLKFLARYGMVQEIEEVYLSMDTSGPTAADTVTYTTMFTALLEAHKRGGLPSEDGSIQPSIDIGPKARLLWTRASRPHSGGAEGKTAVKIDNTLASIAIRCLLQGRPEDQRLAISLIHQLWKLPKPSISSGVDDKEPHGKSNTLPILKIDQITATTILHALTRAKKPSIASHYANVFLDHKDLKRPDMGLLKVIIQALSNTGDVHTIVRILKSRKEDYEWGVGIWSEALTAARWDGNDWEAAKIIWGMMLPKGIESDRKVDVKTMSIMMKIALGRGWREVQEALDIYKKIGEENLVERKKEIGDKSWREELHKDLVRAKEVVSQRSGNVFPAKPTRP